MSINRLTSSLISVEDKQVYEVPKGMNTVTRLSIGERSINFGMTTSNGKRCVVLFPAVEVSGIKIDVIGR